MVSNANAVARFYPRLGKSLFHSSQNSRIQFVCAAVVPEPIDNEFATLRSLTEGEAVGQIFFKRDGQVIGFKGKPPASHCDLGLLP